MEIICTALIIIKLLDLDVKILCIMNGYVRIGMGLAMPTLTCGWNLQVGKAMELSATCTSFVMWMMFYVSINKDIALKWLKKYSQL